MDFSQLCSISPALISPLGQSVDRPELGNEGTEANVYSTVMSTQL